MSAAIEKFIRQKRSLSLHKQKRKIFQRRKFVVHQPYDTIMGDLVFYEGYKHANNNNKYILTVIDCFTKKAWTRPLKSKHAERVAEALDDILQSMRHPPRKFCSDKGTEFSVTADSIYNTLVVKYNMVVYTLSGSQFKGSIIERFNRTLKTRLARYFTENGTTRWVDALSGITDAYNNSYHRSIKMTPNEASLLEVMLFIHY